MIDLPRDPRRRLAMAKKMCCGKIKHKSRLAAEYIFNQMNGKDSHLLEIYPCPFCKFHHIGHNRTNQKMAER